MLKYLYLFCLISCFCFKTYCSELIVSDAEAINTKQKHLPINTTIDSLWMKEKVPAHIYGKFCSLSPFFLIDDTFLKENISEKRWQQIELLLDTITAHHTTPVSKGNLGLLYITPESQSLSMLSQKFIHANTITLFTSSLCNSSINLSYSYKYINSTCIDLKINAYTTHSDIHYKAKFQGGINAIFINNNIIQGECSGTLTSFKENDISVNNEDISRYFIILL